MATPTRDAGSAEHPFDHRLDENQAATLVTQYQAGDGPSLQSLHAQLEPAIGSMLNRYRGGRLSSLLTLQDLRQQSWIVLAELATRWRPTGSFLAYFFRSFPREMQRYVRGADWRRGTVEARANGATLAEAEPGYDLQAEPVDWHGTLIRLPRLEQAAFLLRNVEQRDFATIGEQLGMSRTSAYRYYERARAQLAERFSGRSSAMTVPMQRLVQALHATATDDGRIAGRRRLLVLTGLGRPEYEALMLELESRGVIFGRGPGLSGRLAFSGVAETLEQISVDRGEPDSWPGATG